VSEDEREVRERLKRHLRERLKLLKEQHERRPPNAETTAVVPEPSRKSKEK